MLHRFPGDQETQESQPPGAQQEGQFNFNGMLRQLHAAIDSPVRSSATMPSLFIKPSYGCVQGTAWPRNLDGKWHSWCCWRDQQTKEALDSIDNRQDKRKVVGCGATAVPHESGFCSYQGQIGHCGSHEQLKQRLDPAEVARLAHSELNQTRDAVLSDLSEFAILGLGCAVLESARLLQQRFLRMQTHRSSLPWARCDAGRAQVA